MTGRQRLLSPEQETGGGSGEGLFSAGAPFGMAAYAVMEGSCPTDAAPDTAGDVGAVHHDISPEAWSIS
jgi:hypothetical protein